MIKRMLAVILGAMFAVPAVAQSIPALDEALRKEAPATRAFLGNTMRYCKEAAAPSVAGQMGPACEDKLAMASEMATTDQVKSEMKRLDKLRTNILIMSFGSAKGGVAAAATATQGYDSFLSALEAADRPAKPKKKQ